ncbi:DUF3343 domain-containing protein [Dysosmobacter sp.]|uniref:DUF3343 domain-containing protein n=1 Tax=Dysosmobacter sp. TaxID=2591382 RepID=UPI002A92811A|nr:DUF3343 domain-containing protein [Dysosmobacter sp.]MDY5612994.1 DUF3343 domain-containing protein [Dysosmobacter sp.]
MRQKEEKCVVTFRTTAAAMEMERTCKAAGVPGRLIPVPRTITAGCGMCWAAPPSAREAVEELVVAKHLMIDGIYAIIL